MNANRQECLASGGERAGGAAGSGYICVHLCSLRFRILLPAVMMGGTRRYPSLCLLPRRISDSLAHALHMVAEICGYDCRIFHHLARGALRNDFSLVEYHGALG